MSKPLPHVLLLRAVVCLIVAWYIAVLAFVFFSKAGAVGISSHANPRDFIAVWVAGRMALHGAASQAYVWATHGDLEHRLLGLRHAAYFGWHYPPTAFFFATPLALLPYREAFVVWDAVSLLIFALAVVGTIKRPAARVYAFIFPAVSISLVLGQNGLLTASLMLVVCAAIARNGKRPSVWLALLTYKPQFGLLFPPFLAFERKWWLIAETVLITGAMVVLSATIFGPDSWIAFFRALPHTEAVVLGAGDAGWQKLQSAYGLVRSLGGTSAFAWSAQGALAASALGAVAFAWRTDNSSKLKAAALVIGSLLATPYIYDYDLAVLAVAIAMLRSDRAFTALEFSCVLVSAALCLAPAGAKVPLGFFSIILIAAVIAKRSSLRLVPKKQSSPYP